MGSVRHLEPSPPPCTAPHDPYPHDHAWAAPGSHVCSRRFWCRACGRWFDGAECRPVKVAV